MNANWKKNTKPDVVLKRIEESKNVSVDGKVSFSGFGFFDAKATLDGMVDFKDKSHSIEIEGVIWTAISNVAKKQVLEKQSVIEEINRLIKEERKTKETEFHVLTTISLGKPFPLKTINTEGCKITFLNNFFPKRYESRNSVIRNKFDFSDDTPDSYSKIIVSVKSKSIKGAATKALYVIDMQRAIWSLLGNSSTSLFGDEWKPINKIRMGRVHTVHQINGAVADEQFWYEPNFAKVDLFVADDFAGFKKFYKRIFTKLNQIPYSYELRDALVRFVRALDERDQNVSLIKLWGALESITCQGDAKYDLIVRRCSFLFKDSEYHQQVLEHLRDFRNRSVHAGDQNENAKFRCYQLKFYFEQLIFFHIRNAGTFKTLNEANLFLDSPRDMTDLINKKRLIERAIKFLL